MEKTIVLTCTTYFRQDFSIFDFVENFSTIFFHEKILANNGCKIIIINEFSPENIKNLMFNSSLIKKEFPAAIFIQKNKSESGQAHSLNLMLGMIKTCDYHVQWEEGWICTAPFLKAAITLMETTSIVQVGITDDWLNTPEIQPPQSIPSMVERYRAIIANPSLYQLKSYLPHLNNYRYISELLNKVDINIWPLYSLRPSVNKISFLKTLPLFPVFSSLWPVRFEYIYGLFWLLNGGEKGMLENSAARRSHNKKSTYTEIVI